MTSIEQSLQAHLDINPEDHACRMVLADHLEEIGDERAEGYRALGMLGKLPLDNDIATWYTWFIGVHNDSDDLGEEWFAKLEGGHFINSNEVESPVQAGDRWRDYKTHKDAEDAAALAFSKLSTEVKEKILSAAKVGV